MNRARDLVAAAGLCLALGGCSDRLTEDSVQTFVDGADRAFLEGRSAEVCDMRAEGFRLEAVDFELGDGKIMSGLAEAEAYAGQRREAGELNRGRKVTLDLRQFCAMAYESREYYKRATMERGPLEIVIDAERSKATVRAHYTIKEPVYAYVDSPHSYRDRSERQTATRQIETDDESVVIVEDGELKFASTSSVSKSFLIDKQRDRRL
jgi:hypothetical protein